MSDDDIGPVLPGPGASDYERYLRTDELLALQKPPGERIHRDELLFQTVHQSSELWLKLALSEIEEATRLIDADELLGAGRLVRRAVLSLREVTDALDMLDLLDPWDYHTIRTALGHGSGFDSPGFRHLAHATPALGNAFDRALERTGASMDELYTRRSVFGPLHMLTEALTDHDERLRLWRFRHYSVVARAIRETTTRDRRDACTCALQAHRPAVPAQAVGGPGTAGGAVRGRACWWCEGRRCFGRAPHRARARLAAACAPRAGRPRPVVGTALGPGRKSRRRCREPVHGR